MSKFLKRIFISSMISLNTFSLLSKSVLASNNEITVATSANVQFAMEEISKEFEKETNIKVKSIVSSSGKLSAQIDNGAPFDIFVSADTKYPDSLFKKGKTYLKPKIYAKGLLVLWTLKDFKLDKNLNILKNYKVEKIAIANPKNAPYGEQAISVLDKLNLKDSLKSKFVYGDSIAQVNNYIFSKSVDIGITSKSTVVSPKMKGIGNWLELNNSYYKPIEQSAVILKYGQENNLENATKFYNFIFSKKTKNILKKYGYLVN
jgi:molybdate transport system substrate-binding protein